MAQGRSVRRRSDSIRYVRYFCLADGMPLVDPLRTSTAAAHCDAAIACHECCELISSQTLLRSNEGPDEAQERFITLMR